MVHLVAVSKANWKECAALAVTEAQRDWVPANLYSIAEAQFYPDACPLALTNDDGLVVGFALYGRDDATGKWKLFRLMIDAAQQHKGYGSAALRLLIDRISREPDGNEILVCYHASNHVARQLYAMAGFIEISNPLNVITAVLRVER